LRLHPRRADLASAQRGLPEIHSVDIVQPTVKGREIWLRRIAKLDRGQQRILHQLKVQLPERLEPIQILKCSADSAIAQTDFKGLNPLLALSVTHLG
jgi:hypothetical protein